MPTPFQKTKTTLEATPLLKKASIPRDSKAPSLKEDTLASIMEDFML